jgi:transcriptional regulator with XRE-family HTH domain
MTEKERRLAKQFGGAVREHRRKAGWSQAELAEKLSISVDFVGLLERGMRLPSVPVLVEVSRLFGESLDALLLGARDSEATVLALVRALPTEKHATIAAVLRGLVAEVRAERRATPRRRQRA